MWGSVNMKCLGLVDYINPLVNLTYFNNCKKEAEVPSNSLLSCFICLISVSKSMCLHVS